MTIVPADSVKSTLPAPHEVPVSELGSPVSERELEVVAMAGYENLSQFIHEDVIGLYDALGDIVIARHVCMALLAHGIRVPRFRENRIILDLPLTDASLMLLSRTQVGNHALYDLRLNWLRRRLAQTDITIKQMSDVMDDLRLVLNSLDIHRYLRTRPD